MSPPPWRGAPLAEPTEEPSAREEVSRPQALRLTALQQQRSDSRVLRNMEHGAYQVAGPQRCKARIYLAGFRGAFWRD